MNSTAAQRRLRSPPHRPVTAPTGAWLSICLQKTPRAITAFDSPSLENAHHGFNAGANF